MTTDFFAWYDAEYEADPEITAKVRAEMDSLYPHTYGACKEANCIAVIKINGWPWANRYAR